MWTWLDILLVTLIVLLAASYAVYALGTAALRKRVLNWVGRHLGVRAVTLLLSKQGGCDGCAQASHHSMAAHKRK